MTTKTELAALAEATGNGRHDLIAAPQGVQALALMSDAEFDTRLKQLKLGRERIAKVQREYMREDEDYGLIPNTPKPTLFKSGAEKLAQLYGLAARVTSGFTSGDGEKMPPLTYASEAYLHISSFDGPIVAVGHGTANSWEKRYRRDSKVCPNCSQPKIIKSKYDPGWYCLNCKSKYAEKDPKIIDQSPQIGSDPRDAFDLAVTLMKMAEKRAFVDAVLRATATSGLFTQDVSEDPPETVDAGFGPSVAHRQAGEVSETSTAAAPQVQKAEWTDTGRESVDLTEEQFAALKESTGGEEVKVEASNIEGVERGGRTSGANEAQVAEVRRLLGELKWGAKAGLGFTLNTLQIDEEVPEDGRNARSRLSELLDGLHSASIGELIQKLAAEVDLNAQAARVGP